MMSGSGSTCFGLANSLGGAEKIVEALRDKHSEWWVWATFTL
jgi:4-diphosphocytidyl-2C-methyl-D-erythritol kinase